MRAAAAFLAVSAVIAGPQAHKAPALGMRIAGAARRQIGVTTEYDPSYQTIKYPGGDVPLRTGVCSDVVVRALRQAGIDLQKEVHEDMLRAFSVYPRDWGLDGPDPNIDHRRVANLMRYFERRHIWIRRELHSAAAYRPGDVVAWDLGDGELHIGIVSDKSKRRVPLIIHNIGEGAKEEDVLFEYRVIGHYRVRARMAAPAGAANHAIPQDPGLKGIILRSRGR